MFAQLRSTYVRLPRPGGNTGSRPLRLWFLAFVGFGLTIGGWALAAPYDGSGDESWHTLRAYQVASGDIAPEPAAAVGGTGAYQWGPNNLYVSNCWRTFPDRSAACTRDRTFPSTLVRFGNPAGRYNPAYYALVGGPIKIWPNMTGVILARLISAALAAALLAAALVSVVQYSRHRLMLGALLLGATPMAISISGAINPNGVEIAAGIAFFASAIPLLIGAARERPPTWLVCVTVVSAVVLVTVRSGGPVWLALGAFALLLPLRLRTFRQVLRPVALRWGVLVVAGAGVASVLWILIMKSTVLATFRVNVQLDDDQIFLIELERWPYLVHQMVGVLSWVNAYMFGPAYLLWEFPVAALLLVALVVGSRLDRARLLIVIGGTVAVAAITEMNGATRVGFVNQGRYLLPTLSGALLLAAWVIEQRGAITATRARLITRFVVVVTLPIQLHALQVAMVRFQRGIPKNPYLSFYNPFVGSWHPQVGSVLPILSATLGLLLLGVLCWRHAAGPGEPLPAEQAAGTEASSDQRDLSTSHAVS
ncbi:DUF2142 domain-containing protein [Micromonospora sp. NPDC049679]|uniref:DUF2142 domain-containing protein n=1 Tax=Micromonospora sp. NPDC049679 TaxID=3155920 RepID=UPI0033E1208D